MSELLQNASPSLAAALAVSAARAALDDPGTALRQICSTVACGSAAGELPEYKIPGTPIVVWCDGPSSMVLMEDAGPTALLSPAQALNLAAALVASAVAL